MVCPHWIDKNPPGLHMCSRSLLVSPQLWSWFCTDPQTRSEPEEPWPPAGSLSALQAWFWPWPPLATQSCSGPCAWPSIQAGSTPSSRPLSGIHVWCGGKWPTRSLPEFRICSWVPSPPGAQGFRPLSLLVLKLLFWDRGCSLWVSGPRVHTPLALSLGESLGAGTAIDLGSVPLASPPDDMAELVG